MWRAVECASLFFSLRGNAPRLLRINVGKMYLYAAFVAT